MLNSKRDRFSTPRLKSEAFFVRLEVDFQMRLSSASCLPPRGVRRWTQAEDPHEFPIPSGKQCQAPATCVFTVAKVFSADLGFISAGL
jgi:hypothetical protein